ncbi:hypothetical protein HF670_11655 [Acidithiobacillus thiooxidans]|uniref:hypothetical protein n=1 Tax=Acidithiobacillus thiooxidans TaxID=930 RepID=UPI001C076B5F|nr:hypothetical protein [Acidithiobacillus thiooxidans]MBU2840201.1 hypothetical protein [Acidithiobacillus thiooxidans]
MEAEFESNIIRLGCAAISVGVSPELLEPDAQASDKGNESVPNMAAQSKECLNDLLLKGRIIGLLYEDDAYGPVVYPYQDEAYGRARMRRAGAVQARVGLDVPWVR